MMVNAHAKQRAMRLKVYLLRRRFRSWLGPNENDEDHLEVWLREERNARTFDKEIRLGERDFYRRY